MPEKNELITGAKEHNGHPVIDTSPKSMIRLNDQMTWKRLLRRNTNRVPECEKLEFPAKVAVNLCRTTGHNNVHVIIIHRETELYTRDYVKHEQ